MSYYVWVLFHIFHYLLAAMELIAKRNRILLPPMVLALLNKNGFNYTLKCKTQIAFLFTKRNLSMSELLQPFTAKIIADKKMVSL